ncbi:hypothetical protein QWA68_008696 [Fusarium oxysporum]|nr:hypothetical protein QWA68_008696 [Fusarium oxysporum]
MVWIVATSYL